MAIRRSPTRRRKTTTTRRSPARRPATRRTATTRSTTRRSAPRRSASRQKSTSDEMMDAINKTIGATEGKGRGRKPGRLPNTITEKEMMDQLMGVLMSPAYQRHQRKEDVRLSKKKLDEAKKDYRHKSKDPKQRADARDRVRKAKLEKDISDANFRGAGNEATILARKDDLRTYKNRLKIAQDKKRRAQKEGDAKGVKDAERTERAMQGFINETRLIIIKHGGKA